LPSIPYIIDIPKTSPLQCCTQAEAVCRHEKENSFANAQLNCPEKGKYKYNYEKGHFPVLSCTPPLNQTSHQVPHVNDHF